jgi:hypothetical protein
MKDGFKALKFFPLSTAFHSVLLYIKSLAPTVIFSIFLVFPDIMVSWLNLTRNSLKMVSKLYKK